MSASRAMKVGTVLPRAPEQNATEPTGFPTETEIYILPSGEVIVADLPVELVALARDIGARSEDHFPVGQEAGSS